MGRRHGPLVIMVALMIAAPAAQANDVAADDPIVRIDLPDVPPPQIDDPVSGAELEDLQAIATQKGMSLRAAIDRYAWNDNFALAMSAVREESPDAFTGAEIVDARHAWIGFAGDAAERALPILESFAKSHPAVAVELRTDYGYTEIELEKAITAVHYAIFEAATVRGASTSFDSGTGEITTVVELDAGVGDSALDELRAGAIASLDGSGLESFLAKIEITVVASSGPVSGGTDDNISHIGGEVLKPGCTSAFAVRNAAGVRGMSTAGHCPDQPSDDARLLGLRAQHEGAQGDFQWNTGTQPTLDDFYAGDANVTEVNRRDVSLVGVPAVGQPLCKNGAAAFKDCQEVMKLNVCNFTVCNLVQMEGRLAASGDSGGPMYWNYTAYGLHSRPGYDPFPTERDLFSRADRIDDALGVGIAIN